MPPNYGNLGKRKARFAGGRFRGVAMMGLKPIQNPNLHSCLQIFVD